MRIPIKHRYTNKIMFKGEYGDLREAMQEAAKAKADLRGADLGGADLGGADLGGANLWGADLGDANLGGADLGGANLWGADLGGANLRGANLRGANLRGANLRGAKIADGVTISLVPIQILGLYWPIFIFDSHMKIGCEFHPLDEWNKFDDDSIGGMADGALEFWRQHKAAILGIARAAGREWGGQQTKEATNA